MAQNNELKISVGGIEEELKVKTKKRRNHQAHEIKLDVNEIEQS